MKHNHISHKLSKWLPSRGNVLLALIIVSALFGAHSVGALPTNIIESTANSINIINYQGYLANSDGDPLTGNYDIAFRLYETPTGGNILWEELWTDSNRIQVTNGVFSVALGEINNELTRIVQNNSNLYLGVAVGTNGIVSIQPASEILPRSHVGSSGSAMNALMVPNGSISMEKLAADLFIPQVPKVVAYVNEQEDLVFSGGADWQIWHTAETVSFTLPSPPQGYRWDISWQFNLRFGAMSHQGVAANFLLDDLPLKDSDGNEFAENISLWRQNDDADNIIMGGMVYQNDIEAGTHNLSLRVTGTGDSSDQFLIRQRWLMLSAILVPADF